MTTTKIQDFGEKIGGAKKDFFSNVKDIDFNSLNAAALKNVKKKSVWSLTERAVRSQCISNS